MALRTSLSHLNKLTTSLTRPGGGNSNNFKSILQMNHNHVTTNATSNATTHDSVIRSFSSQEQQQQQQQKSALNPSEIYQLKEDIQNMTNDDLNDVTTLPGFTTLIHTLPRSRGTTTTTTETETTTATTKAAPKMNTPRNALIGKVVSDKMQKTVNVAVDRYKIVPKYRKRQKYTKKFFAHDEKEVCNEGDLVMIVPCHKISRHKHFMVHEIIKKKGMF